MLVKAVLLLASLSAIPLGVAVAAPVAQPDRLSAREYTDSPRFGGRDAAVIAMRDDADSVRITGKTPWGRRARRDDTDSVRITGDGRDDTHWDKRDDTESVRITGNTPQSRRARSEGADDGDGFVPIKGRDDGPDKETDWGKVQSGEKGPVEGGEWGHVQGRGGGWDCADKDVDQQVGQEGQGQFG